MWCGEEVSPKTGFFHSLERWDLHVTLPQTERKDETEDSYSAKKGGKKIRNDFNLTLSVESVSFVSVW